MSRLWFLFLKSRFLPDCKLTNATIPNIIFAPLHKFGKFNNFFIPDSVYGNTTLLKLYRTTDNCQYGKTAVALLSNGG